MKLPIANSKRKASKAWSRGLHRRLPQTRVRLFSAVVAACSVSYAPINVNPVGGGECGQRVGI